MLTSKNVGESAINRTAYYPVVDNKALLCEAKNIVNLGSY